MASRLATILVFVIVGATLIAGLIVGAQRDDANGPIDLIIVNGKVYPGAGAEMQEAIAVRGNQILRVGSNRDVKRLRRPQTLVLDAHGATVLPGFNDARVRLIPGALTIEQLDLSSAATLDEIQAGVREYAEGIPASDWVLGRHGDAALFGAAHTAPRKLLDEAAPDRPIMLTSEDGEIAWANSMALEKAGIGRRTRAPQPGAIVRDRKTGEPTGVLKASAIDLMTHALPQPSHAEKITALRAAIDEAHKRGITSLQTVAGNPADAARADLEISTGVVNSEELDLLDEIRRQGELSIRVYGSLAVSPDINEEAVAALDQLRKAYPDDPMLKMGGVEIACGCEPAQIERVVTLLDKHGWHVMVRATDEQNVAAALDAFERAVAENPVPARGRRFRLELPETAAPDTIPEEDLARMATLGVIAEPRESDPLPALSPLLTALNDAGIRLLFGSDWPDAPLDPRQAIEDAAASAPDAPAPAIRAAIDAYTTQAAFASYDEQRKGTLAPGMLADIVILSSDIFGITPAALKDTTVAVTIVDGKVVYQHAAFATSN